MLRLASICSNEVLLELREILIAEGKPWKNHNFEFVKPLKAGLMHEGVDLMLGEDGTPYAIKRATADTMSVYMNELSVLHELNRREFPYTVEIRDLFYDDTFSYASLTFAPEGDLLAWCSRAPEAAPQREAAMRPLACQIFSAIRKMHEMGLSHRGITLEHILLAPADDKDKGLQVKVIGFGNTTAERFSSGDMHVKQPYKAPELYLQGLRDNFPVDAFAIGVVLFSMATQDYPWASTKRGSCAMFEAVRSEGLKRSLESRRHRKLEGVFLGRYLSSSLVELLEQLLCIEPRSRTTLGEWAAEDTGKEICSVWDLPWPSGTEPTAAPHRGYHRIVAL